MIMLCLDGADGRMLDRYSTDGSLPNLSALRARGGAKPLSAPLGSTDDALWASFQYMRELGEHGRYSYLMPQRNNRLDLAHKTEQLPTFWDELSDQGLRVAILDVPKCRAPWPLNGIQILDWLTHGEFFHSPRSYPPSLIDDVSRRFGARLPHRCAYVEPAMDEQQRQTIVSTLLAEISMKRDLGLRFLQSEAWDLLCIGFSQLHCANHRFWDFEHVPAIDQLRITNLPIFTVLLAMDAAIGAIISAAGTSADCIVIAPTDFQLNGSLEHLMPEVIARINRSLFGRFGRQQTPKWPLHLKLARAISGKVPGTWPCTILPFSDNCLALRISAEGEHKLFRGPAAPRPDTVLLDAVESELLDLRGGGGAPLPDFCITRPSSVYTGRCAANLPDLLMHYPSGYFPDALLSPGIGRVERQSPAWRKGNHRDGGFILACGQSANRFIADVERMSDIGKLAQRVLAGRSLQPLAAE
jgi:hypothetical protein